MCGGGGGGGDSTHPQIVIVTDSVRKAAEKPQNLVTLLRLRIYLKPCDMTIFGNGSCQKEVRFPLY